MRKKTILCNLSNNSERKERSMVARTNAIKSRPKHNLKDKKRRLKEWQAWI